MRDQRKYLRLRYNHLCNQEYVQQILFVNIDRIVFKLCVEWLARLSFPEQVLI